jgi:hypothetical protein
MVYLLQKSHVSKPADMPFMLFATGTDHVGISFNAASLTNKTKRLGLKKRLLKTDHLPVSVPRILTSKLNRLSLRLSNIGKALMISVMDELNNREGNPQAAKFMQSIELIV